MPTATHARVPDPDPTAWRTMEERFPEEGENEDRHGYQVHGYYGLPPVKHSHYHWKTALSYFAEAVGGGSQVIATLIDLGGSREDRTLVRAGRYLALASSLASPALLISELHTPRRWFNMLRIFRPTSPMSIGNLSLTAFGLFSGLAAVGEIGKDTGHGSSAGRPAGRILGIPAAAAGAMICLYTGTELEETSTPLWASAHPMLAPLFGATGMSIGAAALSLTAEFLNVSDAARRRLGRFAMLAQGVQLTAAKLLEHAWRRLPSAGSFQGSGHALTFRYGILGLGILFPLAVHIRQEGGRTISRQGVLAASLAALAGGFATYSAVLEAGNTSADRPRDYFAYTRPATPPDAKPSAGGRTVGITMIGLGVLAAAGLVYILGKGGRQT